MFANMPLKVHIQYVQNRNHIHDTQMIPGFSVDFFCQRPKMAHLLILNVLEYYCEIVAKIAVILKEYERIFSDLIAQSFVNY